jgi:hypothetical protein
VPTRAATNPTGEDESPKSVLEQALGEVNGHGPQALGDYANTLMRFAKTLLNAGASSTAKEEAVRGFGEMLGLAASRPDNDIGAGPDVIWKDEQTKHGVAFELKTEKVSPAEYNKHEVGQAHNHLQWLADNEAETKWEGLLIIGPAGLCKVEASPTDNIFVVETATLAARMTEFAAKVADTRGRTIIERWGLLHELGNLFEWQTVGWFKFLGRVRLKDLKSD